MDARYASSLLVSVPQSTFHRNPLLNSQCDGTKKERPDFYSKPLKNINLMKESAAQLDCKQVLFSFF